MQEETQGSSHCDAPPPASLRGTLRREGLLTRYALFVLSPSRVLQGSMISFLWNWLLIVMLLWFLKSIVESSVQERMADRDQRRIDEWLAAHEEKAGVTTRRMEDRIHEAHPNLPSVLSISAAAASAADEALAIESSGSLLGKVPRETPRDKAAKTGSNKKKSGSAGAGSNKKNSH